MKKEIIPINLNLITRGAMAIALIFIFFSLFRGSTNIINAFLVPLTLYLSTINLKKKQIFTLYAAVIIFCLLFFNIQFFFIIFYCCIAFLLIKLREKNVNAVLSTLILTLTVSFSFWIGIMLTDLLFLTRMTDIVMNILKGNIFAYGMMLLIEGALVGICLLFISRVFYKRLSRLYK